MQAITQSLTPLVVLALAGGAYWLAFRLLRGLWRSGK